jgi:hypothetical protein
VVNGAAGFYHEECVIIGLLLSFRIMGKREEAKAAEAKLVKLARRREAAEAKAIVAKAAAAKSKATRARNKLAKQAAAELAATQRATVVAAAELAATRGAVTRGAAVLPGTSTSPLLVAQGPPAGAGGPTDVAATALPMVVNQAVPMIVSQVTAQVTAQLAAHLGPALAGPSSPDSDDSSSDDESEDEIEETQPGPLHSHLKEVTGNFSLPAVKVEEDEEPFTYALTTSEVGQVQAQRYVNFAKIYKRIRKGPFSDLKNLDANYPEEEMSSREWGRIFLSFHHEHALYHPLDGPQLAKYNELIFQMEDLGMDWALYDVTFRQTRAKNAKRGKPLSPWGKTSIILFLRCQRRGVVSVVREQVKPKPRPSAAAGAPPKPAVAYPSSNKELVSGVCWKFQYGHGCEGGCNWPHTHTCEICKAVHATRHCPYASPSYSLPPSQAYSVPPPPSQVYSVPPPPAIMPPPLPLANQAYQGVVQTIPPTLETPFRTPSSSAEPRVKKDRDDREKARR